MNGISYSPGYISSSILFALAGQGYVQVLNLNLAQQSFTIETWTYLPSIVTQTDFGLFGQCDTYNVCISWSIRNARVTFSINSMNVSNTTLTGGTLLAAATYYHIAIVYDAVKSQQLIYVNGQIDAVSSGMVSPYQGSGTTVSTIGKTSSYAYPNSYFSG